MTSPANEVAAEGEPGRRLLFEKWVSCIPPRTTKQHVRVVRSRDGRVRSYQPAEVKKAEKAVLGLFLPFAPRRPFIGPLSIALIVTYPWRKGEPKRNRRAGRAWKPTKPDIDNSGKLIADALAPKFFVDDAQICHIDYRKQWGDESGIGLKIYKLSSPDKHTSIMSEPPPARGTASALAAAAHESLGIQRNQASRESCPSEYRELSSIAEYQTPGQGQE